MDSARSRRLRRPTAPPPATGSKGYAWRRILTAVGRGRNLRPFTSFEDRVRQQEPDGPGARLVDGLIRERRQDLVAALARAVLEFGMREYVEVIALDAAHHALSALHRVHPQVTLRALRQLLLEFAEPGVLLVLVRPQLAELADVALHGPGTKRGHADVRGRELARQALRQAHERGFRGDVDGAVRDRDHRGHARGVDDVPALAMRADVRQHGEDAI